MTIKVWSWRAAIQKAKIPSTTKLVLFNLSVYMNELGQSCYPTIKQQAQDTGLSERALTEHLRIAEKYGFIVTTKEFYKGQGWLRNTYIAAYPEDHKEEEIPAPDSTIQIPDAGSMMERGSEIPDAGSCEYLTQVPTNTSYNTPINTPKAKSPSRKPSTDEFTLPDWIPKTDWEDFLDMRRSIRKPMTNRAKKLILRELEGIRAGGHDPVEALQRSIMNAWQSVYAPGRKPSSFQTGPTKSTVQTKSPRERYAEIGVKL